MASQNLINGDCINEIVKLEDNTIDLVITSPPYNVDLGNNKYNKNAYDLYNDNKEHNDYINWLKDIFQKIYFKLKSGGRVVINIGDGKNNAVPTHSDIIQFMSKELKYIPMTNIIWQKSQVSNRTSWGSFLSPSSPSFPCPFEYVLVFAKESKKLLTEGETDLTKEEFIKWAYGVWNIAPETKMKKIGHPAAFPVELPFRLIKMLSWKNSTIFDPFMGVGSTGLACKQLNRNFIGIELSEKYFKIAQNRLSDKDDIFSEEQI